MAMKKTTLMTEGNIWKQILFFSIPLILGNLLQQLYNTADSIIVGNFVGSEALAAVGSSGSLINLLISFCMGASAGAGVVIAQYYGANDKKRVQDAVHTTLAIAVVTGAILSIVGIAALAVDGNSEGGYAEFGSVSADFLRRTCVQCDLQYGSWNFKCGRQFQTFLGLFGNRICF